MTRGTRLITLSSRLLRPDTFALMVSPAIADLQFESPGAGAWRTARGYIAVWRAVAGALGHDVACTMTALVSDDHRGVALALLIPALPVLACFWPARHVTQAD